jgi:hypothetical protein
VLRPSWYVLERVRVAGEELDQLLLAHGRLFVTIATIAFTTAALSSALV